MGKRRRDRRHRAALRFDPHPHEQLALPNVHIGPVADRETVAPPPPRPSIPLALSRVVHVRESKAPWRCTGCGREWQWETAPTSWLCQVGLWISRRRVTYRCDGTWLSRDQREAVMAAYHLTGRPGQRELLTTMTTEAKLTYGTIDMQDAYGLVEPEPNRMWAYDPWPNRP
jgi:hypothetical protein